LKKKKDLVPLDTSPNSDNENVRMTTDVAWTKNDRLFSKKATKSKKVSLGPLETDASNSTLLLLGGRKNMPQ